MANDFCSCIIRQASLRFDQMVVFFVLLLKFYIEAALAEKVERKKTQPGSLNWQFTWKTIKLV